MNWLSKSNVGAQQGLDQQRKKIEPSATYALFENHWKQAAQIMESSVEDADGALVVISHLSQMISFLGITRGESLTSEKSCKAFWVQHRCSDQLIFWLHSLKVKGLELSYENELKLVAMLHSLCEASSRDGELLGYVKNENERLIDSWDGASALASLLLEYSHYYSLQISATARYSFILLIQLASKFPGLERSLSQESGKGITNVVVSGLSACFAQLPTFTEASVEQLEPFIEQLKFVDAVTEAAPKAVANLIADCFSNFFLIAVIEPALTQDEFEVELKKQHEYVTSLTEEIGIVTSYFQIICQNLSHPYLIQSLVEFVNSRLLSFLIHRINHVNESITISVSTLSLLHSLFDLYSEDFWFEILLKYLTPQHHLLVSQRQKLLPAIDFVDSSSQFLSLIPPNIIEIVGSDLVEAHFLQYINHALDQYKDLNSDTEITFDSFSKLLETGTDTILPSNHFFPLWKRKYDGTDELVVKISKPPEKVNVRPKLVISKENDEPDNKKDNFTTISLHNGSIEDVTLEPSPKIDSSSILNYSDGYASMESGGGVNFGNEELSTTPASFGPFYDSLLVQLSNWPHLDLDVILMLTQIVSLFALSPIPLISTLILDPSLTLQPYYLSFNTLLKRIKQDLEFQLGSVTNEMLLNAWDSYCYGEDFFSSKNLGEGSGSSLLASLVSPSSLSDQIGESIRRTISGGGSGALASAFKLFNRKSTNGTNNGPKVHPSSGKLQSVEGTRGYSYRYTNRRKESKGDYNNSDPLFIMAKRMILFSHWLLELGAIANITCWKCSN